MAGTVRFISAVRRDDFPAGIAPPAADCGLMGFALVCAGCGVLGDPEFKRRWLSAVGPLTTPEGEPGGLRPVLIGQRIGEPGPLPCRHVLEDCGSCGTTLWIDRDAQDALVGGERPLFLCRPCAATKELETVPIEFLV